MYLCMDMYIYLNIHIVLKGPSKYVTMIKRMIVGLLSTVDWQYICVYIYEYTYIYIYKHLCIYMFEHIYNCRIIAMQNHLWIKYNFWQLSTIPAKPSHILHYFVTKLNGLFYLLSRLNNTRNKLISW
jgi:hypothetical protein